MVLRGIAEAKALVEFIPPKAGSHGIFITTIPDFNV
jgi:hypothetical protein